MKTVKDGAGTTVRGQQTRSPELLREHLRSVGLRVTAPRVAVLQRMERAESPVTHAELADEFADQGWDRATIYRNLIDLTDAGLLRRSDIGDHVWRFELLRAKDDHAPAVHPHFVCNECGTVTCLPGEVIELRPTRGAPKALRHSGLEIQLKGRCDRCA